MKRCDLFKFAFAEIGAGNRVIEFLRNCPDNLDIDGFRQSGQFFQRILNTPGIAPALDTDQQGMFTWLFCLQEFASDTSRPLVDGSNPVVRFRAIQYHKYTGADAQFGTQENRRSMPVVGRCRYGTQDRADRSDDFTLWSHRKVHRFAPLPGRRHRLADGFAAQMCGDGNKLMRLLGTATGGALSQPRTRQPRAHCGWRRTTGDIPPFDKPARCQIPADRFKLDAQFVAECQHRDRVDHFR